MSSISVAGDSSGAISIAAPLVAGSGVLTLPTGTDTLVGKATTDTLTNKTLTSPTITGATITVAATAAPAFSAYQSSAQTISYNTVTKVTFTSEEFDTNNNYASSTFTPTVAGYYQVQSGLFFNTSTTTNSWLVLSIAKNGSLYKDIYNQGANPGGYFGIGIAALVYCNGTTDYVEVYVQQIIGASGSQALTASSLRTWFSGSMIRSA